LSGGGRYLLFSGQAAVLYRASRFSEDVDIWVAATVSNWSRLLGALADCEPSVYKLTPALTLAYAQRGHGFHFTIPPDARGTAAPTVGVGAGAARRVSARAQCP
jgi:hypothetical protein